MTTQPNAPIVAVLIPCYKQPHPKMSHAMNALMKYSIEHGIQVFPTPIIQSSSVHWTRNALVVELLKSGRSFTHVLFCDDDIVPAPNALEKLLVHEKDIIAGLCTRRQDPPIPNARLFDEERGLYQELWEWPDGLIEVGAVGTGFMLISRHAIQQVAEVYFQCLYEKRLYGVSDEWAELASQKRLEEFDKEPNAWWFKWLDREDLYGEYGEDVSFCHKAAKCAGLKIYVDTTVQPEHMGDYGFTIQDFISYRDPLIEKAKREGRYLKPPSVLNPKEKVELTEKISILCPTRGRPENIRQLWKSIQDTADNPVELVLFIDDDDLSGSATMANELGIKYKVGKRGILSDYWNRLIPLASGEILMQCGDDVIFRSKGWDTIVKQAFASYPDRILFAHGDDGHFGSRFGTHGFVHRKWIEAVGYFSAPYFSSDYADVWLNEVANTLGRRIALPFLAEHMHFLWGKSPKDATYQERLERHKQDGVDELYKSLAAERASDVEKLRAASRKFVSVLIPSRGRSDELLRSIKALAQTATPSCVEVLVRLDEDDDTNRIEELKNAGARVIVGPRFGYDNLHLYYNELADKASGDWFLIWNDDAQMKTQGWDRRVARLQPGLRILNPCGVFNTFPIVHRSVYELLGHLSLQAHTDTWLQAVARESSIEINLPLQIAHAPDEKRYSKTREEFFSQSVQAKVKEDVEKIMAALKPEEELAQVG